MAEDRVAQLKRVQVLSKLDVNALREIAKICRWQKSEPGVEICSYGDPSTDVYFLISGSARVSLFSEDGVYVFFVELAVGDMFGEVAAIDRKRRSAAIQTTSPCVLASLTADQLVQLIMDHPQVALAIMRQHSESIRRLTSRVIEFSTMPVPNRIRSELLRLAKEAGGYTNEVLISPVPTLEDIAARVSTNREAVCREFQCLIEKGIIRREHGRRLRILDIQALAALLNAPVTKRVKRPKGCS